MTSKWGTCLDRLQYSLSEQEFRTWIKPLSVNEQGKLFTIYGPNQFFLDWVRSKYKDKIVHGLCSQGKNSDLIVEFMVEQSASLSNIKIGKAELNPLQPIEEPTFLKPTAGPQMDMFGMTSSFSTATKQVKEEKEPAVEQTDSIAPSEELYGFDEALALPKSQNNVCFGVNLKEQFRFENFVEGKSNEVAKAAAIQVSANPGAYHNPLFFYGGSGLGKTHLMHSIGNEIRKQQPEAKVLYVSSEKFVRDMVDALRLHAMDHFQDHYRSVDVLLVDDIQFIAGKGRSQEEFFHMFNALLDNGKQVVLSCDRYPKEIPGMEDRLKSRFGHGLTVTIDLPDLETRVAILMSKSLQLGVEISHEVAFYIAKYIRSNVRELEGALRRVITHARVTRREITPKFVGETLKDIISIQHRLIKVDNIQKVVADYYNLKVADLLSKQKSRDIARPRQVAMTLAKELTNHSLPEIGNFFGGRDHTTVLHAVKTITKLQKDNFEIRDDYQILSRKLST
jgi:chromosomal replication initiator protein